MKLLISAFFAAESHPQPGVQLWTRHYELVASNFTFAHVCPHVPACHKKAPACAGATINLCKNYFLSSIFSNNAIFSLSLFNNASYNSTIFSIGLKFIVD